MEGLEQTLRKVLKPFTQNLPPPIRNTATQLLGDSCYRSLIHNLNFRDIDCLKLALSKSLGLAIVSFSAVVKVPQLLKLLNSQSAEGLSFLSYLLETSSYLITLLYNIRNKFPFSTYGEMAFIVIQDVAISVLVLQYSGRASAAAVFVAGLAAAGYAMYSESICSMGTMQYLQAGAGVLGVASKVPQIATIFQEGGTGQLSAFAVFTYLGGSLARVFTTLQEVPDKLILYGFIAAFALNAIIAGQMVYYWNSPQSKETSQLKLEEKGKQAIKEAVPTTRTSTTGVQTRSKNSPSTRRRG